MAITLVPADSTEILLQAKRLLLDYLNWLHQRVQESYNLDYKANEAFNQDIEHCQIRQAKLFLIKKEDVGVGICLLKNLHAEQVEIKRFYIDQTLQGKGFGKLALLEVFKLVSQSGGREVILETTQFMDKAQHLYADLGFIERNPYEAGECPVEHRNIVKFMQKDLD